MATIKWYFSHIVNLRLNLVCCFKSDQCLRNEWEETWKQTFIVYLRSAPLQQHQPFVSQTMETWQWIPHLSHQRSIWCLCILVNTLWFGSDLSEAVGSWQMIALHLAQFVRRPDHVTPWAGEDRKTSSAVWTRAPGRCLCLHRCAISAVCTCRQACQKFQLRSFISMPLLNVLPGGLARNVLKRKQTNVTDA